MSSVVAIVGVQVSAKLADMASDAKGSIVLVILSVFVCYSTVAWLRTKPRVADQDVATPEPAPVVTAERRKLKKKKKTKKTPVPVVAEAKAPEASVPETRHEPAPFNPPAPVDTPKVEAPPVVAVVEQVVEDVPLTPAPEVVLVETILATPPRRVAKKLPAALSPPVKMPAIAAFHDYVRKEPIVPSSPTSSASTVSSASFSPPKSCPGRVEAKRALSPVPRPPPMLAKPKKLVRSHSSTADGRMWRDVLGGSAPPPPVLTKTVSLDASSKPLAATVVSHPAVIQHIIDQIVFYFSEQNLMRDVFLRQRMDAEGYVYISVVLNFNRVRAMMAPSVPLLTLIERLDACPALRLLCKRLPSGAVDPAFVQLGKVRPAVGWQQWVPANALPTHHPFDILLRKANAATSA
ncbi:hypothetical protein ACHHYP_03912 [Achlya hypogyna]|uniref:HTH La-type RNA-binding domain-containing protein n=1 Tax=Achlya hypogyna TaxID=1202772 RepID=A0A1V9Z2M2_ACHHY|nr:hypothetical protein ACHHYP_03912 [Achlya hypogyna]